MLSDLKAKEEEVFRVSLTTKTYPMKGILPRMLIFTLHTLCISPTSVILKATILTSATTVKKSCRGMMMIMITIWLSPSQQYKTSQMQMAVRIGACEIHIPGKVVPANRADVPVIPYRAVCCFRGHSISLLHERGCIPSNYKHQGWWLRPKETSTSDNLTRLERKWIIEIYIHGTTLEVHIDESANGMEVSLPSSVSSPTLLLQSYWR